MATKYNFICKIFIISCILYLAACSTKNNSLLEGKWISLALETEKYIQKSKQLSDSLDIWLVIPDSVNYGISNNLYSGVAGIVLFYLELYHATNNNAFLNEAILGADYLMNSLQDTTYKFYETGLYTGVAGTGYTLLETFKVTKDEKYKNAVIRTVSILEKSSSKTKNGIQWGGLNDIVYGSAGIGLYLQYLADELKYKKADSLSLLVADGLIDNAIQLNPNLRWKYYPEAKIYMDNFSHGTAGVAYFIAQTYQKTLNKKYLDVAIHSAKFIDSLSNEKGYVPHHSPGGEDLYYLGWCHGPVGTNRLYYSLFEATKNEVWLNKIKHSAKHIMQEGIDEHETPGFWNNVGLCCGTAGVAEHYLWLYDITNNQEYLDFSNRMTEKLIQSSTKEKGYIKWVHAEHRVKPDYVLAQTGLMQGSAGIGLWFLQLHAHELQKKPLINLPDKPLIKSLK